MQDFIVLCSTQRCEGGTRSPSAEVNWLAMKCIMLTDAVATTHSIVLPGAAARRDWDK